MYVLLALILVGTLGLMTGWWLAIIGYMSLLEDKAKNNQIETIKGNSYCIVPVGEHLSNKFGSNRNYKRG